VHARFKTSLFVAGAGCWGATLASMYASAGRNVILWEPDPGVARVLARTRRVAVFPGLRLHSSVRVTADMGEAAGAGVVLIVTPSRYLRETCLRLRDVVPNPDGKIVVSCVKGMEPGTMLRPTEIIRDLLRLRRDQVCVLSGPSHAEEVAANKPAAVTLAVHQDPSADGAGDGCGRGGAVLLQRLLSTPTMRVYTADDVVGVEMGGILKNVYAIAAGVCDGLGLGDNAKAALITRAMKELVIAGRAMGGEARTFFGLSGLGDLLTTAFSRHSRNRLFGELLVRTGDARRALAEVKTVVEGARTIVPLYNWARRRRLDLPIAREVYRIVEKAKPPRAAIATLFARTLKPEFHGYT